MPLSRDLSETELNKLLKTVLAVDRILMLAKQINTRNTTRIPQLRVEKLIQSGASRWVTAFGAKG